MDLILEARTLLDKSGYATKPIEMGEKAFHFEDNAIIGFCVICDRVEELLQNWNIWQNNFLERYADYFQIDPQKAWNIYSVFLAIETPKPDQVNELLKIEENFKQKRKIVRANIQAKKDLGQALLHLLPIKNVFKTEGQNFEEILKKRISKDQKKLLTALNNLEPEEIITKYME